MIKVWTGRRILVNAVIAWYVLFNVFIIFINQHPQGSSTLLLQQHDPLIMGPPFIEDQQQDYPSQTGSPPSSPTPQLPQPRHMQLRRTNARLPLLKGKCTKKKLHGTDSRLRVNADEELPAFGGSTDCADPDPSTEHRQGRRWVEVKCAGTLGTKPRDFVIQLGSYCQKLDIHQEIHEVLSINPADTMSTLVSLATAHSFHTHNNNMARFWQSIIEI